MNSRHRLCSLLFSLVTGLTLAACSGGGTGGTGTGPTGDFSIAISPNTITLVQGASSTSATLTATALHGLSGNVSVTITGLPAGVSASPASPLTVALGSSVAVNFTAANTATLGPAVLGFTATQGSLNHSASAAMSVNPAPNFGLAVEPGQITLNPGGNSSVNLLATPLNGLSSAVAITIGGLPPGVSASPSNLSLTPGQLSPVMFSAVSSVNPGTISVSFQGVSGSISHSVDATLQVQSAFAPDYSISVSPSKVALSAGSSSAPITVSVGSLNGFSKSVTVSLSGLPGGVTSSVSSMTISAGSTGTFTLSAASSAKPQTGTATLAGSSGSLDHSTNLTVAVDPSGTAFSTTYFYGADSSAADETVTIVNPGIQSTSSSLPTLCANIYVFDQGQELKECCSCPITANGTITLSVNNDLTSNPGNGLPFPNGQGNISIVPGTVPSTGFCDASNPVPAPDLTVWATHIGPSTATAPAGAVVEAPASDLSLNGSNLTTFTNLCGFVEANQSGAGLCTCGTGGSTDVLRKMLAKK
jgi:hypothetical protein